MKAKMCVALALLFVFSFGTAQAQSSPEVTTFIKTYANYITTGQSAGVPVDVQTISDGGYVMLAGAAGPVGPATWLVKADSSGNLQWSEEVTDFNAPPGLESLTASVQQTRDGGYILAGGTDAGYGESALVEKLNSSGSVEWASKYTAGASYLGQIKQTFDGGYIAVGGTSRDEGIYAGLILRLDRAGNVLWQKVLGPSGSTLVVFLQVLQTSDGGFATLGYTYIPQAGAGIEGVLVAKYTAVGVLQWQAVYNEPNGHQAPYSFAQTSDGGYIVAGSTGTILQDEADGLLLKLSSRGSIQWQKAYRAYFGGDVFYSVHQMSDGSYVVAGSGATFESIAPFMARMDSNGNPLWEYLYYEDINGYPISEWFASSTLSPDGGILALGWTEDYQSRLGDLYVVKVNSDGLCSHGCSEIYPVMQPTVTDISLTTMPPTLPVNTHVTPGLTTPSQSQPTTVIVRQDCD